MVAKTPDIAGDATEREGGQVPRRGRKRVACGGADDCAEFGADDHCDGESAGSHGQNAAIDAGTESSGSLKETVGTVAARLTSPPDDSMGGARVTGAAEGPASAATPATRSGFLSGKGFPLQIVFH